MPCWISTDSVTNDHHVTLLAWISLTLSHHLSLSSITSNRSSRLHPVSIQSCCTLVLVNRPTLACLYEGIHRRMSLINSSLFLQRCPTSCLDHLIWKVLEMGGKCLYSGCFARYGFLELFNMAHSILVQFPSTFFSIHWVSVQVVHQYSRIDSNTAWKKLCFFFIG